MTRPPPLDSDENAGAVSPVVRRDAESAALPAQEPEAGALPHAAGRPGCLQAWKARGLRLKREVRTMYLACRDPRVPWYARLFAGLVAAYALSPIDLIPDAIPVIGYLDDLVLVPLGIALVTKMIPRDVMAECRERARQEQDEVKPGRWVAIALIAAIAVVATIWIGVAALAIVFVARQLMR